MMKYTLQGQYKLLKTIIDISDINIKNNLGWSALIITCRNSNTYSNNEIVKLLLNNKADINLQNNNGWIPLMIACRYSNTDSNNETVKLLLDYKADINLQNNDGWIPLMIACKYSNTYSNSDTVKLLLDNKADINKMTLLNILYNKSTIDVCIIMVPLMIYIYFLQ